MSGTYATLLGIYVDEFTSGWEQPMETAPYKFRTTTSIAQLTTALNVFAEYVGQADDLITQIKSGTVKGDDATSQSDHVEMLITAKLQAITSLMAGVEIVDQTNLTKAAALDQAKLKTLAEKLKTGSDAKLLANLSDLSTKITAALVVAIQKSGKSLPSTTEIKKSISAAVNEFDLKGQKPSQSDIDIYDSLSGAAGPFWLDDSVSSKSTST